MSIRTVLIVSYHFAPSPAVGAKRFSFLAREFARLGYDVHVITHQEHEAWHGTADATLPLTGQVHRCAEAVKLPLVGGGIIRRGINWLLQRLLAPVGLEYLWARAATRCALQVARDLPSGVVIATTPPHSAAIAGGRIARALGWPLILDYRDPWSAYAWPKWRRGRITQWFAQRIEAPLVEQSAARILNTPAMRTWFEKFFPLAPGDRNYVVPNGFDAVPLSASPPAVGPIEIIHAGSVFTGRSLVPVLRAAHALEARHLERPIRLATYGPLPPTELQRIREAGLGGLIEVRPKIPFTALFADLQRAHVLLAVVGDHMLYSTPYKVYDYMAAGRPILGLAPRGAALYDLLDESGAGRCVEPDNAAGIEHALEQMLFHQTTEATLARVERYRWSNLAQQYHLAIESVSSPTEDAGARVPG